MHNLTHIIDTQNYITLFTKDNMKKINYWLVKSEPSDYSFSDLLKEPEQTAEWDGVRNYQARNILKNEMKINDQVLYYHSNSKPSQIVGTAIVVKEGYPDFTSWDPKSKHFDPKSTPQNPKWFMVDIKADKIFKTPITLQEVKNNKKLSNMVLVKNSRLSVQPVTEIEWSIILDMSK